MRNLESNKQITNIHKSLSKENTWYQMAWNNKKLWIVGGMQWYINRETSKKEKVEMDRIYFKEDRWFYWEGGTGLEPSRWTESGKTEAHLEEDDYRGGKDMRQDMERS